MNPIYEQVLKNYKKANTEAKEKMISRYGFKNEAEFLAFLGADPAANPNPPAPNPTTRKKKQKVIVGVPPIMHNVHILDASMSMRDNNKIQHALEGINAEISELKKNPDVLYITNTLVHFASTGDVKHECWKLAMKDSKDNFTFTPRGWTALYEAIGETLTRLLAEHKSGEKVLVKIFTDGEENHSSKKWKSHDYPAVPSEALKNVMKEAEDKGFVITFVGTQFDVNKVVKDLNIKKSNTLVHHNTADSVKASFKKSIGATVSYRAAASRGQDTQENFFVDPNS